MIVKEEPWIPVKQKQQPNKLQQVEITTPIKSVEQIQERPKCIWKPPNKFTYDTFGGNLA